MKTEFASDKVITNTLWLGMSGMEISFSFIGTKASITFVRDNTQSAEDQASVAIYVNNVMVKNILIDQPEIKVEVFNESVPVEHMVQVVMLPECSRLCVGCFLSSTFP